MFVITVFLSLYLNVFVLIVQLFQKIPALHEVAPTLSELPFAVTQFLILATFIGLTVAAIKNRDTADTLSNLV